jgi:DNA topoisomerase-1
VRTLAIRFILITLLASAGLAHVSFANECLNRNIKMLAAAKEAGLHYSTSTDGPGISRELRPDIKKVRHRKKDDKGNWRKWVTFADSKGEKVTEPTKIFIFRDPNGKPIKDPKTLARLVKAGVPPAYHDVWYSLDPKNHLQAIGYNDAGDKYYRYHSKWNEGRSETKFERVGDFGKSLPQLRTKIKQDLSQGGLPKDKVLAAIARFLDLSYIRVGNEEYADKNDTYGLTTFMRSHIKGTEDGKIPDGKIKLDFYGKDDKHHTPEVTDPKLAKVVEELLKTPGKKTDNLFRYKDTTGFHNIDSNDVNDYIRKNSGAALTAKDFRTWGGTTSAIKSLIEAGPPTSEKDADGAVTNAVKYAASRLGNTPGICREKYIDPMALQAYQDDDGDAFFKAVSIARKKIAKGQSNLSLEEQTALTLLDLATAK